MKKTLSIMLIIVMLASSLLCIAPAASAAEDIYEEPWFTDVPDGKWYTDSVRFVYELGLMVGTTKTEFSPDAAFSRAMLVTVLWRLEGEPEYNVITYNDIKPNKWYTQAVSWASINGIVSGVGGGKFAPDDPVTREQMTAIFMRYADYLGINTSASADITSFSDSDKVSSYAKTTMKWALGVNLIYGVGGNRLDPKGNATRAQSAAILERFLFEVVIGDILPDDTLPEDWLPGDEEDFLPPEIESTTRYDYDEQYRITDYVTNDNVSVPLDEQGLSSSERRASALTKYDFDKSPIINRDRQSNREVLPSFDIDSTGFVRAGTKLSDLKNKTLFFFTSDTYPAWEYRNSRGQRIDEWQWFKELKSELGLNVKYTVKQHEASTNAVIQYMTAGKQCDIIYSNHSILALQALNISKSIADLVSYDGVNASPGVCTRAMELTKWAGTPRVIAPIGVVDVLWYNQTLTQELGLSDPHVMWENGVWTHSSFKKFMLSAPAKTMDGRKLTAWTCFPTNIYFTWDSTAGNQTFSLVGDSILPTVLNNWNDPDIQAAWDFVAGVNQMVSFSCGEDNGGLGVVPEHIGLYEGTTLMSATMYTQVYRDTEYSKHVQINWVPYPRADGVNGQDSAQFYGFGMLLPKKTAVPSNENIALKFMELWANRFTEAYFDNLNAFEYYNFNYNQRKQYFNFVTGNLVYSPAIVPVHKYGFMVHGFLGYTGIVVSSEAKKYSQAVISDLATAMKYGM